jgi:hypothetical protein
MTKTQESGSNSGHPAEILQKVVEAQMPDLQRYAEALVGSYSRDDLITISVGEYLRE